MALEEVVYPNSPLVEVVFEIRFPGELQVECNKHLFWEKIRAEYPNIRVPHPMPEKAMALMPYKFDNEDKSMTVMLALNSIALSAAKYPGFKVFKNEVLRIYKIFGETFSLNTINRVGWRYINVIPFVRENGVIPLNRFLTLGFKVPESIPEQFSNLNLTFEAKTENATVITKLETIRRADEGGQEALLLDFDYGRVRSGDDELIFDNVPEYLEEAHSKTRQLFEDFIIDEYRQYLVGDVL